MSSGHASESRNGGTFDHVTASARVQVRLVQPPALTRAALALLVLSRSPTLRLKNAHMSRQPSTTSPNTDYPPSQWPMHPSNFPFSPADGQTEARRLDLVPAVAPSTFLYFLHYHLHSFVAYLFLSSYYSYKYLFLGFTGITMQSKTYIPPISQVLSLLGKK